MGAAVAKAEVGLRVNFAWLAGTLLGEDSAALAGDGLFFGEGLGVLLALVGVLALALEGDGEGLMVLLSSTMAFFAEALGVAEDPFLSGEGVLILVPVARAWARVMRPGVEVVDGDAAGVPAVEAEAFLGVDFGVAGITMGANKGHQGLQVRFAMWWKEQIRFDPRC